MSEAMSQNEVNCLWFDGRGQVKILRPNQIFECEPQSK